jgi:uncharacterized membrane protein YgdD (TMEM256/DUF423 family)
MVDRARSVWIFFGALNGFVAVAAGAYGRHGGFDQPAQDLFAIATFYQGMHALALFVVAWLSSDDRTALFSAVNFAGAAFTLGTLLFAGSLYGLALTATIVVPGAAPMGGWLLMLGWLALMLKAGRDFCLRSRTVRDPGQAG